MATDSADRAGRFSSEKLQAAAARLKRKHVAAIPPLVRATGDFPLSFAQERLWFLDRLSPGGAAYNVPGAAHLRGRLAPQVLAASLAEVVRRHAALRTTFGDREGRPFQRVAPAMDLPLPLVDLGELSPARCEEELARLAAAQARRPFDLARGPLARVLLFRLAPGEHAVAYAIHHIVSDGWSSQVFLAELATLYAAFAAGEPSPLPALPLQYPDFAAWQRAHLTGEVLEKQLAYWREQLAGCRGLELPSDRPRPPGGVSRGAALTLAVPAELPARLRELARREGLSLFMVLLTGFAAVLHRWTGETDVPVGSPVVNRGRRELEGLIGFFANTLVLRADLAGEPAFRELLARVREVVLAAHAHQDLPFERMVEAVQPERDASRNPLFQVMCALQARPRREVPAGTLALETFLVDPEVAKLDLTLSWSEEEDRLVAVAEYSTDLYDRATLLRLWHHCQALLDAAAADPGSGLAELPMLGEAERHALVREWNDTAAPAACRSLPARIARHAAERPDAVALDAGEEAMTYGGLDRAAGSLARRLRSLGAGPGTPVALCLERSPALIVGLLAILEAGAAFLSLDPAYPEERLAWLLADASVRLLVTERRLVPVLARHVERALCLDDPAVGAAEEPAAPAFPLSPPAPGDPAYLIYTSGSTGRPKGVLVSHGALANLIDAYARACRLGPAERFLQFSSPSFDASVVEVAMALGTGGTLCLAAREALLPGPGLPPLLASRQVTAATLPPSVLAVLPAAELPALATVIAGGEACPAELAARWGRGRRLVNAYGPTEAAVCATASPEETGERKPTIGRPLANLTAHVLDRGLRPVPLGAPGELCLGGAGLALGYLGRPEQTAARFVPHPWGAAPGARLVDPGAALGARLYKSGDLVRRLASGEIDFLGRLDDQVKVRGFRIEPGEIEAALAAHPAVRQAAVLARPFRPGDLRLVAFLSLHAGRSAGDLRDFLRARLPEHLVPARFTVLPELPLLPSGKADRARLAALPAEAGPAADAAGAAAGGEERPYVAPRTPVEEVLAGIWAEVLGRDRVAADDDFFALSGNSLLATQVAHRVREASGVDLPLRRLFERTTLAELAREIQEAGAAATAGGPALPPLGLAPRDRPLPASFGQEWGWQLQGGPVGATLSLPLALHLSGPLDRRALARAWRELARRHEALRTHYRWQDGRLVQVIAPAGGLAIGLVDLMALDPQVRWALMRELAAAEAAAPFDLSAGPLVRVWLLIADAQEHVLLFNISHTLADGWSMVLLQRELAVLYRAHAAGLPSPLPDPPLQLADFAWWQREAFAGEGLTAQLAWWRRRLAALPPPLPLPARRPRPPAPTFRSRLQRLSILCDAALGLREMARAAGCTLSMALLAGIAALLHLYTGSEDVLISTLFSGRTRPQLAGVVGLFLNTVTLRTNLAGCGSFRELMQRVRADLLEAYAHQDLPFPVLLARLFPDRPQERTALSRVLFNMLSFTEGPARRLGSDDLPGLTVEPFALPEDQAKTDLVVSCREDEDVHVELSGSADLFDGVDMDHMAEDLAMLLEQAVADPLTPLDRLLPAPRHRPAGLRPAVPPGGRPDTLLGVREARAGCRTPGR